MTYGLPYGKTRKRTYKVIAGRTVTDGQGKELFTIHKADELSPTESDAMTHYIADKLNKDKDFPKYYKKYMSK